MIRLEAVVECTSDLTSFPWTISICNYPSFIRLWGGMSDEEIGTIMAQVVLYSKIETSTDASTLVEGIISSKRLVLLGGIRAVDDENQVTIAPGCCCGLETWREWLKFAQGGSSPWIGHDPDPWIERKENFYCIWSMNGLEETPNIEDCPHITCSFDEFNSELLQVSLDLKGFLSRLSNWVKSISPSQKALVQKIDRCFEITRPARE